MQVLPNELLFGITNHCDNLSYVLVNEQFYEFFKIRFANISQLELKEILDKQDISGYDCMKYLVKHNNNSIIKYLEKHITLKMCDAIELFKKSYNVCPINHLIDTIYEIDHRTNKLSVELLNERMRIPSMCIDYYDFNRVCNWFDDKTISNYVKEYGFERCLKRYLVSILPDESDYVDFPDSDRCKYVIDIVKNFSELKLENHVLNDTLTEEHVRKNRENHFNSFSIDIYDYMNDISIYLGNIDLYICLWNKPWNEMEDIMSFYNKRIFHEILDKVNDRQLNMLAESIVYHRAHLEKDEIFIDLCEWLDVPKLTKLVYKESGITD